MTAEPEWLAELAPWLEAAEEAAQGAGDRTAAVERLSDAILTILETAVGLTSQSRLLTHG